MAEGEVKGTVWAGASTSSPAAGDVGGGGGGGGGGGMMDLEKELSCSICTDVLYQPLTLLDCLHTFCGACLKEWFSWQAAAATGRHPYTCPSCRASVRGTKPNATVTTLLEMYMQANPGKGKSAQEKEEAQKLYKPGDNVLPRMRSRGSRGAQDADDRDIVDEIRQISLREAGIGESALSAGSSRGNERSRDRRHRESGGRYGGGSNDQRTQREISSRQVEHQSSLRSLLSASELDSHEMEEEIMRQIVEEGLLDGIDLENLDVAQEDEISERIAQAYRRRQREREHERARTRVGGDQRQSNGHGASLHTHQDRERTSRRSHARSESGVLPSQSSRPPISRPHLFDNSADNPRQHRRSSSHGRVTGNSLSEPYGRGSLDSARPVVATADDRSGQPLASQTNAERPRRLSHDHRRSTDPVSSRSREGRAAGRTVASPESSTATSPRVSAVGPFSNRRHAPSDDSRSNARHRNTFPRETAPQSANHSSSSLAARRHTDDRPNSNSRPSSSSGAVQSPRAHLYPEPNIKCDSCHMPHIEYELHYNCGKCRSGNFNLCLRCYRQGNGCLHWYGFGRNAWIRYQRNAPPDGYPAGHDPPHVMTGHRYRRPLTEPVQPCSGDSASDVLSNENPAERLEAGVFCDMCSAFSNNCYWKCDACNDGAWGFCNNCVNQGYHCTHPLLPVTQILDQTDGTNGINDTSIDRRIVSDRNTSDGHDSQRPPTLPPVHFQPVENTRKALKTQRTTIHLHNLPFTPLTFSAECDICHYPIPPSHSRFHCPECNDGDYDICNSCYNGLVSNRSISAENGPKGWRRCPRGHRMMVVGFEDRDGGQRRVVVREIVGGYALKDDRLSLSQQQQSPTSSHAHHQRDTHDPAASVISATSSTRTNRWTWKESDGSLAAAATVTATADSPTPHSQSQSPVTSPNPNQATASSSTPSSSAPANTNTPTPDLITSNNNNGPSTKPFFPPDGGVGHRVHALWSYFPASGVADELMFPRGGEIREAEDINGDWFWGRYGGRKGLFPGNYGRVL